MILTEQERAEILGRWVKKQREEGLGLTIEELATRIGCSKGYLSKIEKASPHSDTGRPPAPTLEFLYNLSQKLGASLATPLVELGYLKKSEADKMGTPTGTAHPIKILHYYSQLSEKDQLAAIAMVKSLWESRQRESQPEPEARPKAKPATKKSKSA